jgi:dTDP-4-dehydrorhamnose 3,5-epimerase
VGVAQFTENKKQLWVPPGFSHSFLVLSEAVEFLYKTTNYWHAACEKCVVWNSSILNIKLPDVEIKLILNSKDADD